MVEPGVNRIDILIPARRLTSVTATSIGNVLADNPNGEVFVYVLTDGVLDRQSKSIMNSFGASVSWLRQNGKPRGPAWARNKLASASSSEFLVFVDSDVLLPPQFCSRVRNVISAAQDGVVLAPRILPTQPRNVFAKFYSSFVLVPTLVGGQLVVPTATVIMSRLTWDRAHPFNEHFVLPGGEDWEWFIRNRDVLNVEFRPDLFVAHQNPSSVWQLARRAWRNGVQDSLIPAVAISGSGEAVRGTSSTVSVTKIEASHGTRRAPNGKGPGPYWWRNKLLMPASRNETRLLFFLFLGFSALYRISRFIARKRVGRRSNGANS